MKALVLGYFGPNGHYWPNTSIFAVQTRVQNFQICKRIIGWSPERNETPPNMFSEVRCAH